jgi:F0F1-type ATP synthase assembly protein I
MKQWRGAGLAMELSWTLLFSLLIPLLLGIWLDKQFNTTPILTLIGVFVGILAATLGMARMVVRMFRTIEQDDSDKEAGNKGEEDSE